MPNLPTAPALPVTELNIVKIAAALVTAAILLAGLYYGRDILIPFAIAFLITFALTPRSPGLSDEASPDCSRRLWSW
jgi:hypothetical protein